LNYSENTTKRLTQKWCIQLGTRSPFKSHSRRILAGLGKQLATMLQRANLEVLSAEGGFYLFPDFEPYRPQLQAKAEIDEQFLQQNCPT
jgi:hypothetical protein